MEIPKQLLNAIRSRLKLNMKGVQLILEQMTQQYQKTKFELSVLDGPELLQYIYLLNQEYADKFGTFLNHEEVLSYMEHRISFTKDDIQMLQILISSLSKEGAACVTYALPRLILSFHSENFYYQYFILSAIKYNATHEKTESYLKELEVKLQSLEKQMTEYIMDDLTLDVFHLSDLEKLYREYLTCYVENLEFYDSIGDYNLAINESVSDMSFYLGAHRLFFRRIREAEEKQVSTSPITVSIPTKKEERDEDTLEREKLKRKQEEILAKKQALYTRILSKDELLLLEEAKVSNNIEATTIVKDISDVFDWIFEGVTDEERVELETDIREYFLSLREILHPKQEEIDTDILYYRDKNFVSYLSLDLEREQKGTYKQIYLTLSKIFQHNFNGDREVNGNLPIRVWSKGNDYKIFYTTLGDKILIIRGFEKQHSFDEIKKVITSHEFLNFYENLKATLPNHDYQEEVLATEQIMNILSKSSVVRARIQGK